jgi:hypothetical protein
VKADDGTVYVFAVDGNLVKIKDNVRTEFWTAFTLPSNYMQITAQIWPSGMLEVIYQDTDGSQKSRYSLDDGVTWA